MIIVTCFGNEKRILVNNMKIEKVNDHQIKCTLTKADLAARQLKLSELAYGTEKAKDLFRDMMQQANIKFGFEAEDIPLMIEAIPLNGDCIVLIITKVEDPEELDTRFSKFAPSLQDGEDSLEEFLSELPDRADEILDLFRKVQNSHMDKLASQETKADTNAEERNTSNPSSQETTPVENITKLITFSSLNALSGLACMLSRFYEGCNTLYKNPANNRYYLVISQTEHKPEDFNRLCNILSEHGQIERYSKAHEAYMQEHFKLILKDNAIQSLSLMEMQSYK